MTDPKDYASNSKMPKDDKPEETPERVVPDKIVTGQVIRKPKGIFTRVRHVFLGGEATDAGRYLAGEVLLPAFRNLLVDAIRIGTERIVYGESQRSGMLPSNRYAPMTNYQQARPPYRGARDGGRDRAYLPDQPGLMPSRRNQMPEIILQKREDAEAVLEELMNVIDRYDVASVADLYARLGYQTSHVDNKWGWTNLRDVTIRQNREGYVLVLPDAEPI